MSKQQIEQLKKALASLKRINKKYAPDTKFKQLEKRFEHVISCLEPTNLN